MLTNNDVKYELAQAYEGGRTTEQIPFHRVLISGAGFLADAYDLFVINIAADLMSRCEYKQSLTSSTKGLVKSMAVAGAIVGQVGFGVFADLIGRKRVFIATCALVIAGALLSGLVTDAAGSFGIYSQLALWRFVLGVGVGGEYPLSAAITTESSASGSEIRNLAMVCLHQHIRFGNCSDHWVLRLLVYE
jgi:PHS family inorganic phosphate transporter-like MFS transporter